jgi:hypothetical protein
VIPGAGLIDPSRISRRSSWSAWRLRSGEL